MPELPDIDIYCERLLAKAGGARLTGVRVGSPFVLRTVEPPLAEAHGQRLVTARRVGKRVALGLDGGLFLVVHLMIAGRLKWRKPGAALPKRGGLVAFDFETGALVLTEAGSKRRASLHVVAGEAGLAALDPGGYEILDGDAAGFAAALRRERRTLKRALTDPRLFSGVGNAYSDEILFHARLSMARRTDQLDDAEVARLHAAAVQVLADYRDRLRAEVGAGWPKTVTAFRPDFAVHGRYGQPCPHCEAPVQRIRYGDREANYCARCQNADRLLKDRGLSRLLKQDWPRTLADLEARRGG